MQRTAIKVIFYTSVKLRSLKENRSPCASLRVGAVVSILVMSYRRVAIVVFPGIVLALLLLNLGIFNLLNPAAPTAAATASDAAASDTPPDTEVDKTVVFSLDPLGKPGCEGTTPCTYTFQSTFADGKEIIRIDDYPFPDAGTPLKKQQEIVRKALSSFEETNQPYIIGASPLLWEHFGKQEEHVDFLNSVVKVGFVVFHGFDHSTGWKPFQVDTGLWKTGGEFSKYAKEQLERNWQRGDAILSKVKRYTRRHFIPPFNCITQDLVDVLVSRGTKYIHTFDGALKKPPADAIPHPPFGHPFGGWVEEYKIPAPHTFVVATLARSYGHSTQLKIAPHGPQITLHWVYDNARASMHDEYVSLARKVQSWAGAPAPTPTTVPTARPNSDYLYLEDGRECQCQGPCSHEQYENVPESECVKAVTALALTEEGTTLEGVVNAPWAPHGCHVGSSTKQIFYNTARYNQASQQEQVAGQKNNYWSICSTQKSAAASRKASST